MDQQKNKRWYSELGSTPVDEGALAVHGDWHLKSEGWNTGAGHLDAHGILGGDDGAIDGGTERGHRDEVPLFEL